MSILHLKYLFVSILILLTRYSDCCTFYRDCNNSTSPLDWYNWCENSRCVSAPPIEYDWFCPDTFIPIYNEEKCSSSSEEKLKCEKRNGICVSDHCCPNIRYEPSKIIFSESIFVTNFPCSLERKVPFIFRFSYCDPKRATIVILGKKEMKSSHRLTGKLCRTNKDCDETHLVCAHLSSESEYQCIFYELPNVENDNGPLVLFNMHLSLMCGSISIIMYLAFRYNQRKLIGLEEIEEKRKENLRKEWYKKRMAAEREKRRKREAIRKAEEEKARREAEMKAMAETAKGIRKSRRRSARKKGA